MPDRPDNPIGDQSTGESPGREQRVGHVPTHQHLDTDALSAFIDDRLEADLSVAAAGHIASCSDCRRELAELRATVSLLSGLPQYRPGRSFVLGPEYAHPVRTSRFARFLPLLPRLQAAGVACLLLLLAVGAGDVLTQIGDNSDSSTSRSFESDQAGNSAFQLDPGVIAGDGTGGDTGNAEFGGGSASEPESDIGDAGDSVDAADDESAAAGDAPAAAFSEPPPAPEREEDSPSDSQSITAASAPEGAESAAEDADSSDALGEAPVAADDADAADSEAAGGNEDPPESAAADVPADAASDGSANGIRSAGTLPAPAAGAVDTDPVPTIGIATVAPPEGSDDVVAQADASGMGEPERQSGTASESGISNWRLIEIVLGIVLILLGALVIVLHRLKARARRIGIIR